MSDRDDHLDEQLNDQLDEAVAGYLLSRDSDASLEPTVYARTLQTEVREAFLAEINTLTEIDRLADSAARDIPQWFGGMRILGCLGVGGMGTVYEAEDAQGERLAIKILHPAVAAEPRVIARLEREASLAKRLDHPNIVGVRGTGETDGSTYLTMDVVSGRSFARLLVARKHPDDPDYNLATRFLSDPKIIVTALADAADALQHAHARGVVHRDIKPANLMRREDGSVCVLDFGLARGIHSTAVDLTQSQEFLGTPMYVAPEQATGTAPVGPLADIYGLGAVAYECLTRQPPVRPGRLQRVLDDVVHRDPIEPFRLSAKIDRRLSNVVMKALEKRPDRRYGSAAAFAEDLRAWLGGAPVQARPIGRVGRISRRLRKRPLLTTVFAVLGLLAVAACGVAYARHTAALDLAFERDLTRVTETLALAPEGIIVCGGLAINWYRNFGLGHSIPPGEEISEQAQRALQLARRLHEERPHDRRTLHRRIRACIDVGKLEEAQRVAANLGDSPVDRALFGLTQLFAGKLAASERVFADLEHNTSPDVDYFRATFHMVRHDYAHAVRDFSRALHARGPAQLSDEYRYYAHLMRGWCRSLPEVSDYRAAQDDLRSAAAIRPGFGTPQLLWAALRALDPESAAAGEAVSEASRILTAVQAPWLTVLTARLLLGLAEPSADLPGPLSFNGDLSPLVSLPLETERWQALVSVAKGLLTELRQNPDHDATVDVHYATALALQRDFDGAIAVARSLAKHQLPPALPHLLEARIQLAAGRTGAAGKALERARALAPRHAHTWICAADLASARGNTRGELDTLQQAVTCLAPHSVLLPRIQIRIARLHLLRGAPRSASATLRSQRFGNALSGALGARARAERAVLMVQASRGTPEFAGALDHAEREVDGGRAEGAALHALFSHLAAERLDSGSAARSRRLLARAQAAVGRSWWKPLVFRRRGWLRVEPSVESHLLASAAKLHDHGQVVEALARVDRERAVDLLTGAAGRERRVGPLLALADAMRAAGARGQALAVLRSVPERIGSVTGHNLRRTLESLAHEPRQPTIEAFADLAKKAARSGQADAQLVRAVSLLYLERTDEVLALLRAAQTDDPDNHEFAYLRAIAELQRGRRADAKRALEAIDPADLTVLEQRLGFANIGPKGFRGVRALRD